MSFVAVLPSIYPTWTERCLASCAFADDVMVVDNTVENRGVARSWNLGIDAMDERGADWLVIMSAALRFGEPGGLDFLAELEEDRPRIAVEAAHGVGWHLLALSAAAIEKVGRFDENFAPAYMEDVDWSRRAALAYDLEPPYWDKVSVDVAIAGFAHGIDLGGVKVDHAALRRYMERKWGNATGTPIYKHPFNDPAKGLDYWPDPSNAE